MTRLNDLAEGFIEWCHFNLPSLRREPAPKIADICADKLLQIDSGLGVEIQSDLDCDDREMIITAFSDPTLFPVVNNIIQRIAPIKGWRITALKPARGFEFSIWIGNMHLAASELRYYKTQGIANAFVIVFPRGSISNVVDGANLSELCWLVVETGVGELRASRIDDLDFEEFDGQPDLSPITELAASIK